MATARKTKTAQAIPAEATVVHTPVQETVNTHSVHIPEVNSFARTCTAWILGITASCGIGALAGTVIAYALVGASVTGAAAWISALIFTVGACLATWLGGAVSRRVYDWVADHEADAQYTYVTTAFKDLTSLKSNVKEPS